MSVFQITSLTPQPGIDAALTVFYPANFFKWGDRTWFVRSPESAQVISQKLGVRGLTPGATEPIGSIGDTVITQLFPSYWGWAPAELWAWLQQSFQAVS